MRKISGQNHRPLKGAGIKNWLAGGIVGAVILVALLTIYQFLGSYSTPSSPLVPPITPTISSPTANKKIVPDNAKKLPAGQQESIADKKIASNPLPTTPQGTSGISGVPILMYHYVGNNPNPADRQRDILSISPDKLDAQLNWLSTNGYTPITLDTLYGLFAQKENVTKPIVLTFDDGYIDFYTTAFPILRKHNFRAVSFLPTGLMGTSYYMSWDQIREIKDSGLVSFQAHTVSHAYLPKLSSSDKLSELINSKKVIEQTLGTTVNFIAYPFGASNPDTWYAAKSAGFIGGVGTWYGKATGPGINMPRIRIAGATTLEEFIQKVER